MDGRRYLCRTKGVAKDLGWETLWRTFHPQVAQSEEQAEHILLSVDAGSIPALGLKGLCEGLLHQSRRDLASYY